MNQAPVALFVYNRPWHTRQTVEALLANAEAKDTDLYVFSDGAKNDSAGKAASEVRSYVSGIVGFHSITVIERETNFGLAKSITNGVTQVCQKHGRIIVLEDDHVTSPYFLKYMNEALNYYEHDERVISIAGYIYPVMERMPETFFLRGADCWGWATWARGWELFNPDGQKLLDELKRRKLTHQFDFDGSYPYTKMLQNQIAGKNNSWAIRWYASAFLKDKLTLYPGRSLLVNIGMDDSGSHCSSAMKYEGEMTDIPVQVGTAAVEENAFARQSFITFFRKSRPYLFVKVFRKIIAVMQRRIGMQ
ncbi:glycosyltransferase [Methylobacter sp.]|uniref:glycosyltransferase n=1 Tax=Methylobacter sp. TaxID=2051955 RepID=UPI00120169CB|nr:glycosyltransferase [Methylobacter sp.]TAK64086.1 MAG: glycosyltransferase [Methylobacter sp.]